MRKILPLLLVALFLSACSFVSDDGERSEKIAVPDIILEDAKYTLGQSGESPILITSSRMVFYSKDERATAEDMSFLQYDDEGNITLEGRADHADIDTGDRSMLLSGTVRLVQHRDGMRIEAEELYFSSSTEEIEADGTVRVQSADGIFSGTGFKGDLREESYSFRSIEEGVFTL